MKVVLGQFTCDCLEAQLGYDAAHGLRLALRHYVRLLESGIRPPDIPAFRRRAGADQGGREVSLLVEPRIRALLYREARKQAVSLQSLFAHVVFVYLAEVGGVTV